MYHLSSNYVYRTWGDQSLLITNYLCNDIFNCDRYRGVYFINDGYEKLLFMAITETFKT
ncbi:hypothetical protein SASC261_24020 [Staphylococcus argenteus]|nr:hypothetical protein SASC261_24020 [Staphylococcus argenteus]